MQAETTAVLAVPLTLPPGNHRCSHYAMTVIASISCAHQRFGITVVRHNGFYTLGRKYLKYVTVYFSGVDVCCSLLDIFHDWKKAKSYTVKAIKTSVSPSWPHSISTTGALCFS